MLDVIDLFGDRDTRDELGIGRIRDTFADLLFPGTSTLQTRAKYFLFIPWIYRYLEDRNVSSREIGNRARRLEVSLIEALVETESGQGVIGQEARARLQRLPSSIYWQGLAKWRIRFYPGSRSQYHHSLDSYYGRLAHVRTSDDGDRVEARLRPNWHPGLPDPPDEFPERASFALTGDEAEYLTERILASQPESLLAFLVDQCDPSVDAPFVWFHPERSRFPQEVSTIVSHARRFSEVIHGAALLYNLMLSEKADWLEKRSQYRSELLEWAEGVGARRAEFQEWDMGEFWSVIEKSYGRMPPPTRRFVDEWIQLMLSRGNKIIDDSRARECIHARERTLKGSRARLGDPRMLELWSGAAGTGRLDYRWLTVRTIIHDIVSVRSGVASHA